MARQKTVESDNSSCDDSDTQQASQAHPVLVETQRRPLHPRLDFPTPRRVLAFAFLCNGIRRPGVSHSAHTQSPNKGPLKEGTLHVAWTAPLQTSHNRMRPSSSPPPHARQGSIIAVTCAALSVSHTRPQSDRRDHKTNAPIPQSLSALRESLKSVCIMVTICCDH